MKFVHLHLHTTFSILNGVCKLEELAKSLEKQGAKAAAITDHGNMFGVVGFYDALKKRKIKPIIGCELFLDNELLNNNFCLEQNINHLTVLCENKEGYENLVKIVSASYVNFFKNVPRVSFKLLKKHKKGLIFLSGCRKGEIATHILNNEYDLAKNVALKFKDEFGEANFFLEVQDHGKKEEKILKNSLIKLSKEVEVSLVATNNVHYIKKEEKLTKKILSCIKNNEILKKEEALKGLNGEKYLKSYVEMKEIFSSPEEQEALKNTVKIAKRCNFSFEFFKINIPKFNSGVQDNEKFLLEKAKEGLFLKFGKKAEKEVMERFEYEFNVISKMGFVDYFLIVWDYVSYVKKKGIFVGPGRGSGAGSLISFCLGITEVNPIEFGLSFERFLNEYRIKLPDFDVDFCNERRHEVIEYVIKKYGKERVARIITFGTLAAKAALRDVARVLAMPYEFADSVVKKFPNKTGGTLSLAFKESKEFKEAIEKNADAKLLFNLAEKVEGLVKNTSTHAAAVVITKNRLDDLVPVYFAEDVVLTQYAMGDIERLKLLKMDFLGLRNLTILSNCEKLINEKNRQFKVFKIPLNDKKTFKMLSLGDSVGVFQLESKGMRTTLKKVKPLNLKDVMDILALNRPGPSQFIDLYVKNKENPKNVEYLNEKFKEILKETHGVIIYQEQVMKIFKEIAGYSLKRIDIIRKAISKKDCKVMEKEAEFFIYGRKSEEEYLNCPGALKKGFDEKTARKIFNNILKFASYAFNKSHAAAYSIISYKTAYLKCNFLVEYFVCLLNSVIENKDKLKIYLKECEEKQIKILPLSVNESEKFFKIENENSIRFSFLAVKNVSANFSDAIVKERTFKKYVSLKDFLFRVLQSKNEREFSKNAIVSLFLSGAFKEFKEKFNVLEDFEVFLDEILSDVKNLNRGVKGQISFFEFEEKQKKEKKFILTGVLKKIYILNLKNSENRLYVLNFQLNLKVIKIFIKKEKFNEFYKDILKNIEEKNLVKVFVKLFEFKGKKYLFLEGIKEIEEKQVLYILLSEINFNEVLKILRNYEGESEVVFLKMNKEEKKFFKNSKIKGVKICEDLENCLKKVVGEKNYYVKTLQRWQYYFLKL